MRKRPLHPHSFVKHQKNKPSQGGGFPEQQDVDLDVYLMGKAWEDQDDGQQRIPRLITALSKKKVIAISAGGGSHFLALTSEGKVIAGGSGPAGQLGLGEETKFLKEPQYIASLQSEYIVSISAAFAQSAAISNNGNLYIWGSGHQMYWEPVKIEFEGRVLRVALGSSHIVALCWPPSLTSSDSDNVSTSVYSWGLNFSYQLGHGDTKTRDQPTLIQSLENVQVRDIAAGECHNTVVTTSYDVYFFGTLIESASSKEPILIKPLQGQEIMYTTCATKACFAITKDGRVFSWGEGRYGLLAHGNTENKLAPEEIEAFKTMRIGNIICGSTHCTALTEPQHGSSLPECYVWGNTRHNKLGPVKLVPNQKELIIPTSLGNLDGQRILQTACGSAFTLLLTVGQSGSDETEHVNLKEALFQSMRNIPLETGVKLQSSTEIEPEDDFRIRVHIWEKHQFLHPVWCMVCSKLLWGLLAQHYRCQICGYTSHAKCKNLAKTECTGHHFMGNQETVAIDDKIASALAIEEREIQKRLSEAQSEYSKKLKTMKIDSEVINSLNNNQIVPVSSDSGSSNLQSGDSANLPEKAKFVSLVSESRLDKKEDLRALSPETKKKKIEYLRDKLKEYRQRVQDIEEMLVILDGPQEKVASSSGWNVKLKSGSRVSQAQSGGGPPPPPSEDVFDDDDDFLEEEESGTLSPPAPSSASFLTPSSRKPRAPPTSRRPTDVVADSKRIHIDESWEIDPSQVEIIKVLGEGTSGQVFKGRYRGQDVAVKIVRNRVDKRQLEDFEYEFSILRQMKSKCNVFFYGACLNPNLCLVMEYCSRGSLWSILNGSHNYFTRWSRMLKISLEIARGVHFLHSWEPPVVHRDLKSHNILIDANWNVKIADFGLARLNTETYKKGTLGKVRGTYSYTAPEIYYNHTFTDKSDVYSISIIIWEMVVKMVTGKYQRPYSEFEELQFDFQIIVQTARGKRCTIPPNVPSPVRELIERMWSSNPDSRPSAAELVQELQKISKIYRQNKESWDGIVAQ